MKKLICAVIILDLFMALSAYAYVLTKTISYGPDCDSYSGCTKVISSYNSPTDCLEAIKVHNRIWIEYYKPFAIQRNKGKSTNQWSVKESFPDIIIEATDSVKSWEIMKVHFKCD